MLAREQVARFSEQQEQHAIDERQRFVEAGFGLCGHPTAKSRRECCHRTDDAVLQIVAYPILERDAGRDELVEQTCTMTGRCCFQ